MFANHDQFILFKKVDKVPISPLTLMSCDAHSPANWVSEQYARDLLTTVGDGYGVGFVFTANDLYWFLDIDHCLIGGVISPLAREIVAALSGVYVEISKSGEGLHLFGAGACPPHGSRNSEFGLEFYTELRYAALTGNVYCEGSEETNMELMLPWLIDKYFGEPVATNSAEWTDGPVAESSPIPDDDALIAKMLTSGGVKQAFSGSGCHVSDLWNVNITMLSATYPDPARDYDASSADAALSTHLAFWTGKDCNRIERLMRRSGLMREKWDRREHGLGYLKKTILKGVDLCNGVYGSGNQSSLLSHTADPPEGPPPPPPDGKSGFQLLTPENQVEHFKGCVYIRNDHKIWIPDGSLLKPDQFRAWFGGFNFSMDSMLSKTTRSAWEAFTESQAVTFPKVAMACFRPLLPSGKVFEEEGLTMTNVYVPIETERKVGDPSPFLDWVKLILPDEMDRKILLSFMAALIQFPGIKFQWCPIIQGMEGNGKSMIMRVIAFAVGKRYTHLPKSFDLSGNGIKFNHWMLYKLFVGIEEIFTSDRHQVTEAMKTWVTDDQQEIQGKGADQVMADTIFNMVMNTNHKDAVRTTFDQRRYATFFCAQQSIEDLKRDGMTGNYFPKMYDWLRAEGYAIMNNYLREYAIEDEFNPAIGSIRAPLTTSTREAVAMSMGAIEQEILDAIEEGRPGFAGGWVSSIALNTLLEKLRATGKIPQNKRRDIMNSLGYDWHRMLNNGRVNNPILVEGGKPKLFVQKDHINNNLSNAADVVRAYCKAQNYAPGSVVDGNVNKA